MNKFSGLIYTMVTSTVYMYKSLAVQNVGEDVEKIAFSHTMNFPIWKNFWGNLVLLNICRPFDQVILLLGYVYVYEYMYVCTYACVHMCGDISI